MERLVGAGYAKQVGDQYIFLSTQQRGFQDKVQIDPSEEGLYAPGVHRHVFEVGTLAFGIVICHEGWRYPETVRWAARRGALVVFHPEHPRFKTQPFIVRKADGASNYASTDLATALEGWLR